MRAWCVRRWLAVVAGFVVAGFVLAGCHLLVPLGSGAGDTGTGDAPVADAGPRPDGPSLDGDAQGPVVGLAGIAPGGAHTCIVSSGGSLWCWGDNRRGQCAAAATNGGVLTPHQVPLEAQALASGYEHSCAIDTEGRVWCWGDNRAGQSVPGQSDIITEAPAAVGAPLPVPVRQLSLGRRHSCAIVDGGAVWCWGDATHGVLGNVADVEGPARLKELDGATRLSCGAAFCCVLRQGEVWCWGDNERQQLGSSAAGSGPQRVQLTQAALDLGCGDEHCCAAVQPDRSVVCWGSNGLGQLGQGVDGPPLGPTAVSGPKDVSAVCAGNAHTCVLSQGKVYCWGYNRWGQTGAWGAPHYAPQRVAGIGTVTRLSCGGNHVCAEDAQGALWCWGDNTFGALGLGKAARRAQPVVVMSGAPVSQLAAGGNHSCALRGGKLGCWGWNADGQLGQGSTDPLAGVREVSPQGSPWELVALGAFHSCARSGSAAHCWGAGWAGQLGTGSKSSSATPAKIQGLTGMPGDLAAAHGHSCALQEGGSVTCWGQNDRGQLGQGTMGPAVLVAGQPVLKVSNATAVAARYGASCAIREGGAVSCWGWNGDGQLGIGTYVDVAVGTAMVGLPQLDPVVDLELGVRLGCARTGGGAVYCWGANTYGQLGSSSVSTQGSAAPVKVELGQPALELSVGAHHVCVVLAGGGVRCWGANESHQLGQVSTLGGPQPVTVSGLPPVERLALGWQHSCAATADGTIYCWGNAFFGQLDSAVPSGPWGPVKVLDHVPNAP